MQWLQAISTQVRLFRKSWKETLHYQEQRTVPEVIWKGSKYQNTILSPTMKRTVFVASLKTIEKSGLSTPVYSPSHPEQQCLQINLSPNSASFKGFQKLKKRSRQCRLLCYKVSILGHHDPVDQAHSPSSEDPWSVGPATSSTSSTSSTRSLEVTTLIRYQIRIQRTLMAIHLIHAEAILT